jgi:ABC-type phosphate/phosphonate transport system permease subunit
MGVKSTTARALEAGGTFIFAAVIAFSWEDLVHSHRLGSWRLTLGDYLVRYIVPNLPPPRQFGNLWLTFVVAFLIDLICWFVILFGLLTLARRILGAPEEK